MMNAVALCLVLSSLTTASIWSAHPETSEKKARRAVIVKEGHRVIVVEYEKEIPVSPKVPISTQESDLTHKRTDQSVGDKLPDMAMAAKEKAKETASVLPNFGQDLSTSTKEKAKEAASVLPNLGEELSKKAKEAASVLPNLGEELSKKAKEAASVLPNLGQGLSTSTQSPPPSDASHRTTPKELICDALGKCKHKLAGVLSKAKDKAEEGAEQAKEKAKDLVEEGLDKAKGVIDTTKSAGEKLAGKVKQSEEKAEEIIDRVETNAHQLKEEGKENLTDILRRGREVGHDALSYVVSSENWAALMGVIRLLGFSTAYGTCVWVTFVSSYILAGALPRQQFGIVQSKIYPVYFKAMAYCIAFSLVAMWLNPGSRRSESVQSYILLTSLAMVLVNLIYLEPRATKVMFERMKMEKEEGRGRDDGDIVTDTSPRLSHLGTAGTATTTTTADAAAARDKAKSRLGLLNRRLKRLNTRSSFLNILTLMALTWHLVDLGQRLHISCTS
ncbi:hypothetical protein NE237_022500 [Protea cynaroides]|uniref:TMEM205-like domain-containing protein n=1 Tax=Protea cynaroides TaxID=273540 RepID=A0A9Q0HC58_9MAGN|nr:hypothetical protein NE237_022500 [Protea cynaroides]